MPNCKRSCEIMRSTVSKTLDSFPINSITQRSVYQSETRNQNIGRDAGTGRSRESYTHHVIIRPRAHVVRFASTQSSCHSPAGP